jgi:hypothetical protein
MITLIKLLKKDNFGMLHDDGRIDSIIVRSERDQWEARVGDIGLIVRYGQPHNNNLSYTIKFASGNTGKQYPDLRWMIEHEVEAGNFSFYYIEIKP